MSTGDRSANAFDPEETVADFLTYAELLNSPELARLYTYVLRNGPVTVETIKTDLDTPHSTAYKYVRNLEGMGVLTRHDDETPATVSVEPVRLVVETDHGELTATPALVDAIGRQLDADDVRVFVDRRGIAKLAAALHYAVRVRNGDLTQRTAATRLDVHPVEAMTVLTALQDVLDSAADYDPYLDVG